MITAIFAGLLSFAANPLGRGVDADPEGYLAKPPAGIGKGVLVLHPWWGLNSDTKAYCRRLAEAGFVAFAPDLFHGKTATKPADAEALVKEFESKNSEISAQISAATKYLAGLTTAKSVAVVGFSFGAYYALQLSNAEPEAIRAVVVYYGTGHEDFSKSKSSYLGHFAESDDFEPKANVDALSKLLKDAGRPATVHTYPGTGHWFAEPSVEKSYNPAAADQAWKRTVEFLRKTLNDEADGG